MLIKNEYVLNKLAKSFNLDRALIWNIHANFQNSDSSKESDPT